MRRWHTVFNWKICPLSFGTSTRTSGRGFFVLVEVILHTLIGSRPWSTRSDWTSSRPISTGTVLRTALSVFASGRAKEWKVTFLSSSRRVRARKSSEVPGLTRIPSTQGFAFVKAMCLAFMPLEIDGHFDASRMMTGGILLSAGGFCCATGLVGAGRGGWA
jgi:hypothetical protein